VTLAAVLSGPCVKLHTVCRSVSPILARQRTLTRRAVLFISGPCSYTRLFSFFGGLSPQLFDSSQNHRDKEKNEGKIGYSCSWQATWARSSCSAPPHNTSQAATTHRTHAYRTHPHRRERANNLFLPPPKLRACGEESVYPVWVKTKTKMQRQQLHVRLPCPLR